MNTELKMALETLEKEKDISKEVMLEAIENSLITACKGHFGKDTDNFRVEIDRDTYDFHVYVEKTVVEQAENDVTEISLPEAKLLDSKYEIGDIVREEVKSKEFGRITTQNARNVILQKIREEERKVLFNQYYTKEKDVVTGVVQRYMGKNVSVNLGKVDAVLNENEMVKGEVYRPTERIKVYILEVKDTPKGPRILVSRTHPELVKRLFESEVTEVRDGVYLLAERCVNEEVGKKLAAEMKWYDNYLAEGEVDRSANPTPGNKKGGLANIVEKAMGSIAKSGTSPIVEVLSPAEKPSKKGLIYAATPASDIVCGPCQLASGIGLQVFMTGRGTPYGLAIAPVIKVCSRNEMKEQWPDLIDINAGPVATGEATIADIGTQLFMEIIDVASGRKQSFAEKYKLYNDLCIFNPAPIT